MIPPSTAIRMKKTTFRSRVPYAVSIILLTIAGSGCTKRLPSSKTGYIVGGIDNIEQVSTKNRSRVSEKQIGSAVAIVVAPDDQNRRLCSGTLIDSDSTDNKLRIISNYHCFTLESDTYSEIPEKTLKERCGGATIFFGLAGEKNSDYQTGKCDPDSFRHDILGDLSLFKLKENPDPKYEPAEFHTEAASFTGKKGLIVHFPKPDSAATISDVVISRETSTIVPRASMTADDCIIQGDFSKEERDFDPTLKVSYKHTCDLKIGSSG
ncbi:MAG: hypothetical protein HQK54_15390, partial [Oligoflexales bacterium]|nr:hypothetical protein [Oligoflexales bacterium]